MHLRQAKFSEEPTEIQIVTERASRTSSETRSYSKGRFLGKGGFARVYEFTDIESKATTAGKVIPKANLIKTRAKQKLMSEIKIHRSLRHPNIVSFERFFEDSQNVYILLELCTNQTLSELVKRRKRLTELETQCYLSQIIGAISHLHKHRVIHRDIKLGNIFINDKMELKLGDFGLASKLEYEGERKRTICGTPNYIAPQILDGKQGHSYEVDVWSLGVLAYTLLIGKPPFETQDIKTTYRRIRMNAYSFPTNIALSTEAKELISSILNGDPSQRPTIDQIAQFPFFTMNAYPSLLPASTLAVPLSAAYINKFVGKRVEIENVRPEEPEKKTEKRCASVSCYRGSEAYPRLWVVKWVDYSGKYGLGYLLSNGSVGASFNDSTRMVSDYYGSYFEYADRSPETKEERLSKYLFSDFPEGIQKKVTLLEHFRKHLLADFKPKSRSSEYVSVKKWLSTPKAVIFRLSNKLVQVSFQDHTELILCSESKTVVYVDKQRATSSHALSGAMETGNGEMTKRLKYTKEVLTNMLQSAPLTDRRINQDFIISLLRELDCRRKPGETFESTD